MECVSDLACWSREVRTGMESGAEWPGRGLAHVLSSCGVGDRFLACRWLHSSPGLRRGWQWCGVLRRGAGGGWKTWRTESFGFHPAVPCFLASRLPGPFWTALCRTT